MKSAVCLHVYSHIRAHVCAMHLALFIVCVCLHVYLHIRAHVRHTDLYTS